MVQFSGESLEIKHECWINTGLDFVNCLFLSESIYFTEYGDLYSMSLDPLTQDSGSTHPETEGLNSSVDHDSFTKKKLMSFENKIVCILEAGENKKYVFLENGIFYELDDAPKSSDTNNGSTQEPEADEFYSSDY